MTKEEFIEDIKRFVKSVKYKQLLARTIVKAIKKNTKNRRK